MKKFAFVADDGQVSYVMSTGSTSDFYSNTRYGEHTAIMIDGEVDNHQLIATQYWDGTAWQTRDTKPSNYHEWVNFQWQFNQTLFMQELRSIRDDYLKESDWTQMPDSPLTATQKTAWADYRQALRDLPQNVGEITSLEEVVWPIPPN